MTLQGSGAISLEQIRNEFGQTGSISMSQLYKDGGIVPSTSSSTANQGGSLTTDSISFIAGGQDASGSATSTKALGTTIASGDTFSSFTYSGAFTLVQTGGFSLPVARVFFSNSSGSIIGSLLSFSAPTHNQTGTPVTTNYNVTKTGTTVSSNHVGATHISSQVIDSGGQFRVEDTHIEASMNAFTFTITQNRTVTTNINPNVPTNGTISFQNFYGATA